MKLKQISYPEIGVFTPLFLDYIAEKEKLKKFFTFPPTIDSFAEALEKIKTFSFDRKLISEILAEQNPNSKILASEIIDKNTFTVCTGHQLCLFTGPLYFIYKIISAINLTETLKKKYPQYNFIPVYWLASEDHDFEEINHINIFGKRVEWKTEQKGAVGKFKTELLENVIEELKSILGESENDNSIIKLFSDSYLQKKNLSEATRHLVSALFKDYDLLIFDADDARLKKQFASILSDDIFKHTNQKLVAETSSELKQIGYEVQVSPRDINVFYLKDGERKRIDKPEEKYKSEIETNPERFSPNVVLRPMYQQMILPNIAYVGGGAEISYWLQYKKMFEHHKINFPVLVPRNSVLWIDEKAVEQMEKLDIDMSNVFKPMETLTNDFLAKKIDIKTTLANERGHMLDVFEKIKTKAAKADITLKQSAEADLQKVLTMLTDLEKKMLKAEKQKHKISLNQIRKLKEKLFPNGELQERYDNFIPFYLKHGKDFIKILKENLNPLELKFLVISE